jgi:hypothetical protein
MLVLLAKLLNLFHGTEFWDVFSSEEWFGTEFREFCVPRNSRNAVGINQSFRLFRLPGNNFFVGNWQPYSPQAVAGFISYASIPSVVGVPTVLVVLLLLSFMLLLAFLLLWVVMLLLSSLLLLFLSSLLLFVSLLLASLLKHAEHALKNVRACSACVDIFLGHTQPA